MSAVKPPFRMYDGQWVNVVNHDDCYRGYSKEEAVAKAVKLAEQCMAANAAELTAMLRRFSGAFMDSGYVPVQDSDNPGEALLFDALAMIAKAEPQS